MTSFYISMPMRQYIAERARYRCGYCQTQEIVIGMPLQVEHIIPLAAGGTSDESNLWLACAPCNGYKRVQTHALDPETHKEVPLFNPCTQNWSEHFRWSEDGMYIIGVTSQGRATVVALKMNRPMICHARQRWVAVGWHPPHDEKIYPKNI